MTFAKGFRAILRHDPDIILVGEIRDRETAGIAIQAAMTGHMVFSTLHTNDASSAVLRLIDIGVDPFLLSSTLLGVFAQRLVRKICPHSKETYQPMMKISQEFIKENFEAKEFKDVQYFRGKGCKACRNTGYQGRVALMEVLPVTEEISKLIVHKTSAVKIKQIAIAEGMRTLQKVGWIKVLKGITTLEEVMRVTNI